VARLEAAPFQGKFGISLQHKWIEPSPNLLIRLLIVAGLRLLRPASCILVMRAHSGLRPSALSKIVDN
jgi:hypothetical protein